MGRRQSISRVGFLLSIVGVVAAIVGVFCVLWVVSQTDTGMMCQSPYTDEDRPGACSVYGLAFWVPVAGVIAFIVGLALSAIAREKVGRGRPGADR